MKKTGEKNSYFRKILLALLTVNMVPILFLGASIINMVKQQSHMVNRNMISMVDNEVRRIERNFQAVEKALIELSLDSDMALALRTEFVAKNFQIFNGMRGRLQRIVNTAQDVDDIFVMNQNKGWIVSASLSTRAEHYPEIQKIQELYEVYGQGLHLSGKAPSHQYPAGSRHGDGQISEKRHCIRPSKQ